MIWSVIATAEDGEGVVRVGLEGLGAGSQGIHGLHGFVRGEVVQAAPVNGDLVGRHVVVEHGLGVRACLADQDGDVGELENRVAVRDGRESDFLVCPVGRVAVDELVDDLEDGVDSDAVFFHVGIGHLHEAVGVVLGLCVFEHLEHVQAVLVQDRLGQSVPCARTCGIGFDGPGKVVGGSGVLASLDVDVSFVYQGVRVVTVDAFLVRGVENVTTDSTCRNDCGDHKKMNILSASHIRSRHFRFR